MVTRKLNVMQASLLTYAIERSPMDGLRINDVQPGGRVALIKAALEFKVGEDGKVRNETDVEFKPELWKLLQHAWENIPLGTLHRTDVVTNALTELAEIMKDDFKPTVEA